MRVYFKDFSKGEQKSIKSILEGAGYQVRGCRFYRDGNVVYIELKDGNSVKINL